jgi:hypothetical protein
MKRFNIFLVLLLVFSACKENKSQSEPAAEETKSAEFQVFGDTFDPEGFKSGTDLLLAFGDLNESDSLTVSFKGEVTDVCKMKGCWIKVALDGEQEVRVTFKDYGFFVPKDIAGKQVTLHGKGFIEELSVEDQVHFAEDGGASKEEIAQITSPKVTYSFVADGVLLND